MGPPENFGIKLILVFGLVCVPAFVQRLTPLHQKSIDFITAVGQVIQTEKISTIFISLADGKTIKLQNIAFALGFDLNLILLDQLWESDITYHDEPSSMTFMRDGKTIACAKKSHNLFIFDLAMSGQIMSAISRVMTITGWGQPTHHVNQKKRICFWHRQLAVKWLI